MVCWGCDRIVVLRFFWELCSPEQAVKLKQPVFSVVKGDQLAWDVPAYSPPLERVMTTQVLCVPAQYPRWLFCKLHFTPNGLPRLPILGLGSGTKRVQGVLGGAENKMVQEIPSSVVPEPLIMFLFVAVLVGLAAIVKRRPFIGWWDQRGDLCTFFPNYVEKIPKSDLSFS